MEAAPLTASSFSSPPLHPSAVLPSPPLSPPSVLRLMALNAELARENAQMKEALSRTSSRRASIDGRDREEGKGGEGVEERQMRLHPLQPANTPSSCTNAAAPHTPSESKEGTRRAIEEEEEDGGEEEGEGKEHSPGEAERARRERRRLRVRAQQLKAQTLQGGMARRINELRGEVLQSLSPSSPSAAVIAAPSLSSSSSTFSSSTVGRPLPLPLPHPRSSLSVLSSVGVSGGVEGSALDRTRSLPLRAVRAQRKTAPADLSTLMEQWKALHEQGGDRSPAHEPGKTVGGGGRLGEAMTGSTGHGGGCGGSDSSRSSGDEDDEDEGRSALERRRRQSVEEKEQGRRQSWVRGAATMSHAEVRLMMDMMKQATLHPPTHSNDSDVSRHQRTPPTE